MTGQALGKETIMALRPDVSITSSLAVAGLVYGIFQISLPSVTDVKAANPNDKLVKGSEKTATWIAAGVVSGISLISRDANVFILGGSMTVALAWYYKHANKFNPITNSARAQINSAAVVAMPGEHTEHAEAPAMGEADYAFA